MRDPINEIFSDQGIEELRQRLGLVNQPVEGEGEDITPDPSLFEDDAVSEFTESDSPSYVEPRGISFPQNIRIPETDFVYRVGPDGATVVDIIVQFDEVVGASDYSVKYVPLT